MTPRPHGPRWFRLRAPNRRRSSTRGRAGRLQVEGMEERVLLSYTPIVPSDFPYNPSHQTVVGNTLFFTADDGYFGEELWKTDGTLAGTVMVKDINITVPILFGGTGGSSPDNL